MFWNFHIAYDVFEYEWFKVITSTRIFSVSCSLSHGHTASFTCRPFNTFITLMWNLVVFPRPYTFWSILFSLLYKDSGYLFHYFLFIVCHSSILFFLISERIHIWRVISFSIFSPFPPPPPLFPFF